MGNREVNTARPSEPGEQEKGKVRVLTRPNHNHAAWKVLVRALALTVINLIVMDEEIRLREGW